MMRNVNRHQGPLPNPWAGRAWDSDTCFRSVLSLSLSLSGLTSSTLQGAPLSPEVQGSESRGIHHAGPGQWS